MALLWRFSTGRQYAARRLQRTQISSAGRAHNRIVNNHGPTLSRGRLGLNRRLGGRNGRITLIETRGNVPTWRSRWNVGKSWSAGVSPAMTNADKMPALPRGSGLNAVRESGRAGVSPAIHQRTEKPRERGLRFTMESKPLPGVKRRAFRPPTAEKARQRACAWVDSPARGQWRIQGLTLTDSPRLA